MADRALMMSLPLALLEAMRPKQWAKNVLLFVGLVFALKLGDPPAVARAVVAFAVFCAVSSAAYLFNDLTDLEQDRQHPRKRRRPLALGRIRTAHAVALGSTLLLGGVLVAFLLSIRFGLLTLGYVLLNVAYNAGLKHV